MKTTEVQQLLEMITALNGRGFPEGAADVWRKILSDVNADDAERAVIEIFSQPESLPSTQLPGAIRRLAIRMRDQRDAAARRALPATAATAPPNAEYLAARAALVQRFGERGGQPQRVVLPDTSSPISSESEITEDARRAAQIRLAHAWAA